jgi:hypothetical protein
MRQKEFVCLLLLMQITSNFGLTDERGDKEYLKITLQYEKFYNVYSGDSVPVSLKILTGRLAALLRNDIPHDHCSVQVSTSHTDGHYGEDSQPKGLGSPLDKSSEMTQTHCCNGLGGDSHGVLDWYTRLHLQEDTKQAHIFNKVCCMAGVH